MLCGRRCPPSPTAHSCCSRPCRPYGHHALSWARLDNVPGCATTDYIMSQPTNQPTGHQNQAAKPKRATNRSMREGPLCTYALSYVVCVCVCVADGMRSSIRA